MALAYVQIQVDLSIVDSYQQDITKGQTLTFSRSGCTFANFNVTASGSWKWTTSSNSITFSSVDSSTMCILIVNFNSSSTYQVSLNANGGTVSPQTISVTKGASCTLPTPYRDGYTFLGWYTSKTGGTRVGGAGSSYTPTKNITLYAHWDSTPPFVGPATVVWLIYEGTTFISSSTDYDIYVGTSKTFTREGCDFRSFEFATSGSWTYTTSGNNITFTKVDTKELYVTVNFDRKTLTVTYNANGGSVYPSSASCLYGSYVTLPTPTKTRNTFVGWYTSSSGGTYVGGGGSSYYPTANVTIYAHWEPDRLVTYNANGGSVSPSSAYCPYNQSVTLPTPTKTRNTFMGWYTAQTGGTYVGKGGTSYYATQDITLYAHWEPDRLITYNPNGGTVSPTSEYCPYNQSVTLPTPTLAHNTFIGWYTAISGGTLVGGGGASYSPTADITLYAHWTSLECVVTFNPNGGISPVYFKRVYKGEAYGTLPTPTYDGRTFLGWYTAQSGGTRVYESTIVTTTSEHTLYAHWDSTTVSHTLTFDPCGGSVSPTSRQVNEGSVYGTLPTPTRNGYVFVGWYTGTVSGSVVTAQTVMGDDDVIIYARWSAQTLTITFNPNGGTVSEPTRQVKYGQQVGTLPTPTWVGKNYNGWFTEQSGGTKVTSQTVPTSSVTYYAHWSNGSAEWTVVKYKIVFETNGGTVSQAYGEHKYTKGVEKTLPTSSYVTRSGYTFQGWYGKPDFSGSVQTVIPITSIGTKTYYAKWA